MSDEETKIALERLKDRARDLLAPADNARIVDLERRRLIALNAVRIASDMLVSIETDKGVVASVSLLRAQVARALEALQVQQVEATPLTTGCHPRLVARLRAVRNDNADDLEGA